MKLRVAVVAFSLAACRGDVGEIDGPADFAPDPPAKVDGAVPSGPPIQQGVTCADPAQKVRTGALPMRRLTRVEYDYSVLDALGLDGHPSADFALDDTVGPLLNNVASSVNGLMAEQYRDAAEALAARVDLAKLASCDLKGDATCLAELIRSVGRKLYRRPLLAAEATALAALAAEKDNASRARLALTAMLQAPSFLYRAQTGESVAGVIELDDYALASRLSYFLWASPPDDTLLDAAEAGTLKGELAAQVKRMMTDAKFARTVDSFHVQWLGLDELSTLTKDPGIYPEFTDTLRSALRDDFTGLVEEIVVRGDGKLASLFSAPIAFVTPELAKLYGTTAKTSTRVELPPEQRSGLLTSPAFLAVHANPNQGSPIKRGVAVRERVFCEGLPPPPADVPAPPAPRPGATTRERFAAHTAVPACAACHKLIDPIGFGLENFDGVGRYRAQEDGRPIDSSGELGGGNDAAGPFNGARELSQRIAHSDDVRRCVASVWARYGLGRGADECTLASVQQQFAAADYDVRVLIASLAQAESFRFGRQE